MAGILIGILAAFIAVVAVRTIRFTPKPQPPVSQEEVSFDRDAAVQALAELVKCKTISYNDHSLEDDLEFDKLISLLPGLYPRVFDVCSVTQLPDRALLLRWPGKKDGDPAVLMAHYDVVPVNEENWEKPPFEAILEAPVLEPAFAQMLPALFGGLGVAFVSKNWKIAVAPVLLMLVLFIFVPALNAGTVGIMVPVSVLFTIAVSRLLYKKGVL